MRSFICLLLVGIILLAGRLPGQSVTGSIAGIVVDPSDLPVVKAAATLLQAATNATRKAETDAAGYFYFGSLQPGEYHLTVQAGGFKRLERRAIILTAAEVMSVGNLKLAIGAVTESVTVATQGGQVQTVSAERSGVLTGSQVETMAIRGRNAISLIALLPGVVELDTPDRVQPGWSISVNGGRTATNNVTIDGATLNAIGNNSNAVVSVSMDAVAEVKALLNNYQAEYGRLSGASVHVITKSGARDFHGLASYWKRHEQFNANEFFNNRLGAPKPRYRINVWNYNVGGPVYIPGKWNKGRDKLFFFWSQEFWPQKTTNPLQQRTTPAERERQGDFSQSLDVNNRLIPVTDPTARQPFPGNIVPRNRIDSQGQVLLNLLPAPNFLDRGISRGSYNYVFSGTLEAPLRMDSLRLDYHANSNNIIGFTYAYRVNTSDSTAGNFDQWRENARNVGETYVGRYQKVFSPHLINELTVSWSDRPTDTIITPETLPRIQRDKVGFTLGQIYPKINELNLIPNTLFGGVPSAATTTINARTPLQQGHQIFSLSNNLTKSFSGHTLKAGFYADQIMIAGQYGPSTFNGAFDFSRDATNPLDTGYAYSNSILGLYRSYTESTTRLYQQGYSSNVEWFVQDNWRVSRRLTLDYGLRFCWLPQSYVEDDSISAFGPWQYDASKAVKLIQPVMSGGQRVGAHPLTGQILPANQIGAIADGSGDPSNGIYYHQQGNNIPRSLMEDRGINFAPRVGFAYDVFGNGTTAVRGGFGMFYNRSSHGVTLSQFAALPPYSSTPIQYFGEMRTVLSSKGVLFPINAFGIDPAGKIPTVMNYSLSVQRKVGYGVILDVGYVGSLGRRLYWARNLNSIPYGANYLRTNLDSTTGRALPAAFLRTYAGYNDIAYRETGASSNFHSMQASANRRFARGLQFGVSWTWGKAMDYNDDDVDLVSTLVPVRIRNYGLASFDRTHVLKINWLYSAPNVPWTHPVLKAALNRWEISGIATFVSGAPLTVTPTTTNAIDLSGSPTDTSRVDVIANPVLPKGDRTFDRNFNTSAFRLPAVGTPGNAAKYLFRGPGINNFDLAIYKSFPIYSERARFQLRWELYNALNHTQFSAEDTTARFDPSGTQVSQTFGQFTAARPSRRMQFALRFNF